MDDFLENYEDEDEDSIDEIETKSRDFSNITMFPLDLTISGVIEWIEMEKYN